PAAVHGREDLRGDRRGAGLGRGDGDEVGHGLQGVRAGMKVTAGQRTPKPPLQSGWGESAAEGSVNTQPPVRCESSIAGAELNPLLVHAAQAFVATALQELVQDWWDEPEEGEGQQIGESSCPRLDEKAAVTGPPRVQIEDLDLPAEVSA